jgi:glycosyltransferase involved in cell wall biosynthesis
MDVALVHDYLTQRGGAERVVLSMHSAFPAAPIYTSLYEPETTYPAFGRADIRPLPLNRVGLLRRNHRLAFPLLAPAFSSLHVDADVVVCSTSGWAHGVRTEGRTVVYCHAPARWLYQTERYLGNGNGDGKWLPRAALATLGPSLREWDRRAARRADRYLANSAAVRDQIRSAYGIDAEVVPPPLPLASNGPQRKPDSLEPGFFLCVSRLLPYKNVGAVVEAFERLPKERLAVVGTGPEEQRLRAVAPRNVRFLGSVADDELRWLYGHATGVVAASYEDYGLTPLEGAALGSPAVVLRWGGFLDTVVEGVTGVFFDRPDPSEILSAIDRLRHEDWSEQTLQSHAAGFSERRFVERIRQIVDAEAA